ncbi:MAG TPA: hypothetical protein VL128_18335 [Candidatus Eisenbacteria bacterium]|nr:hypothetical protein [Candidatus Eisenbacteria bacterium]
MKVFRPAVFGTLLLSLTSGLSASSQAPSVPLGIIGNAVAARIGNSTASEGATVYSGDSLSTADNGVLLVRVGALSAELQPNSSAHIYHAPYGAVLELDSGSVVYSTPGGSQNIVIVASDVRVTPAANRPDFGRVTIDDPCNVSVQSQNGEADVRVGSESKTVEAGKAYRVRAENSISYRKYLSPDATDYHEYHEHAPCAAPYQNMKGRAPISAGHSHFIYLVGGVTTIVTTIGIVKALESPSRP